MPVNFSEFMKKMGTLNAYTPGATTNSSPSSKLSIAKPGGTGTTRPPVKPNPAAPTPTRAGTVSEREVYDDSKRFKQEKQRLQRDTLNTGAALEQAKLALSRTQSAAQIKATNKERSNAFTMANKELAQRRREAAANAANNRAQLDIQNDKVRNERKSIRSNERLGLAKVGAEKYATKTGFEAAQMTDSTNRLKIRNDLELGKLTLASNELINRRNEATKRNATLGSVIAGWG